MLVLIWNDLLQVQVHIVQTEMYHKSLFTAATRHFCTSFYFSLSPCGYISKATSFFFCSSYQSHLLTKEKTSLKNKTLNFFFSFFPISSWMKWKETSPCDLSSHLLISTRGTNLCVPWDHWQQEELTPRSSISNRHESEPSIPNKCSTAQGWSLPSFKSHAALKSRSMEGIRAITITAA